MSLNYHEIASDLEGVNAEILEVTAAMDMLLTSIDDDDFSLPGESHEARLMRVGAEFLRRKSHMVTIMRALIDSVNQKAAVALQASNLLYAEDTRTRASAEHPEDNPEE